MQDAGIMHSHLLRVAGVKGRGDKIRIPIHRRFTAGNRIIRAMVYEEAPPRCRSERKGGRTDPAKMRARRACQRFVARNEGKKENERENERESIVFWENSPATNRLI